MSEEQEVRGAVSIVVYSDPGKDLEVTITGDVLHRHILSCPRVIFKAFREYMRLQRIPNIPKEEKE